MNAFDPDSAQPSATAGSDEARVIAHASGRAWMLQTPRTSYAVAIASDGSIAQRYWGRRLDPGSLDALLHTRNRWTSSFERTAEFEEQLPVGGGPRWGLPALQVRFHDGVRTLEPEFRSAETGAATLRIALEDPVGRVRVDLHYRVHADDDAVDRWVEVINDDPEHELGLTRFDSAAWLIPDLPDYRVSTLHGYWGAETQLERSPLRRGDVGVGSRQGATGHIANPWMAIDDGTATEDAGDLWSLTLAWSGSWHITAQRRAEGVVSVLGGFSQEGVEHRVLRGGSLVSPVMTGFYSAEGFGGASRAWHRLIRERILPRGDELRPVLYNSWEATAFAIDTDIEIDLAERAAELGVELFVVDDGWFHGRTDDHAGLGDWWPDASKFPDGLIPLSRRVHELGMGFGIWVEPEMINVRSELHGAHPEWLMRWPDRPGTELRTQRVLDFGLPAVREHTIQWIDRLVADNDIDFIKWDMNRPFTDAGRPERLSESDDIWRTHTEGVYLVMDAVRARHPHLRIEACASGGARVDLGVLQRVDQVWTSDNTDALDRQTIHHGYSQLYPAATMGAWVTDQVNDITRRRVPLEYRFHVAMTGALGIGADIRAWTEDERTAARDLVARYKTIRRTVQFGDQYRLGGDPGRDQSAVQYVDAERCVVFAFDPHRSLSGAPRWIRLKGLEPDGDYRDSETGEVFSGALLMGRGIKANRDRNDRGWDNIRFSNEDYVSSLTVLDRIGV